MRSAVFPTVTILLALHTSVLRAETDFGIATPAKARRALEKAAHIPGPGEDNETARVVMHRCHIDYFKTLRGILQKDPKSLMDMFKASECAGDGASGEGYGEDIQATLDYCGDIAFSNALKRVSGDRRQAVLEQLVWNRDVKKLETLYPQTFALAPHPDRLR